MRVSVLYKPFYPIHTTLFYSLRCETVCSLCLYSFFSRHLKNDVILIMLPSVISTPCWNWSMFRTKEPPPSAHFYPENVGGTFLRNGIFLSNNTLSHLHWRLRRYFIPKRPWMSTRHGVISQKIGIPPATVVSQGFPQSRVLSPWVTPLYGHTNLLARCFLSQAVIMFQSIFCVWEVYKQRLVSSPRRINH
jgi:hypothetical protein